MKIVAVSDTHGQPFADQIPECDLLIHCGDISPTVDHSIYFQKSWYFDTFVPELKKIPAKNIVFVGGNHDFYLYDAYVGRVEDQIRKALPPHVKYLRDSEFVIDGLKIYGTPWVTNLRRWAFNLKTMIDERNAYSTMPNDVDILVSHAPANKYCDTILEYGETDNLGSKGLIEAIAKNKPKLVLSGHIHSANHNLERMIGPDFDNPLNIQFRCVSLLDESYKYHYPPFVFNYTKENGLTF